MKVSGYLRGKPISLKEFKENLYSVKDQKFIKVNQLKILKKSQVNNELKDNEEDDSYLDNEENDSFLDNKEENELINNNEDSSYNKEIKNDLINRFNNNEEDIEFKKKDNEFNNFLMKSKRQELIDTKNYLSLVDDNILLPGDYIELLFNTSKEVLNDTLMVFTYLNRKVEELEECRFLQGNFKKNKWFNGRGVDVESIQISIGWFRSSIKNIFFSDYESDYIIDGIPNEICYINILDKYVKNVFECNSKKFILYFYDGEYNIFGYGKLLKSDVKLYRPYYLVGYPKSINLSNVVVKGMFKNKMEVDKFTGAKIKTSSGIRGVLKSSLKNGEFRATFEGNISSKDVIYLKVNEVISFNNLTRDYNDINDKLDMIVEKNVLTVQNSEVKEKLIEKINKLESEKTKKVNKPKPLLKDLIAPDKNSKLTKTIEEYKKIKEISLLNKREIKTNELDENMKFIKRKKAIIDSSISKRVKRRK
ncbi:BMS1 [Hepatospora eriocheir]|uniref:BMS1 n=1 Tax=Hepatospora eriocheir TaxID=1081669 RepID=A0A1X0QCX2_9MICR|nr:BMS1 [Hepatospora eriocheir]